MNRKGVNVATEASLGPASRRLADALAEYRAALDAGQSEIWNDQFRQRYADIAAELESCLERLALLEPAAAAALPADEDGHGGIGAPPPSIDGYHLAREIGRGGMGVVFEARQAGLNRAVALKILPQSASLSQERLERFRNEARAAATLDHPHIVRVYAVGNDGGVHYFAMQYVEGGSLAERLSQWRRAKDDGRALATESCAGAATGTAKGAGSPSPDEPAHAGGAPRPAASFATVARWGVQAAAALAHAHERGIIHRDVKPANLLLDGDDRLFVTDFGLARILADPGLTTTGDRLGTLRYMSPEQFAGDRVVIDHRTDVYSLGLTLYELLTLEPAFAGDDSQRLPLRIAAEEPPAPRRRNPAVPRDLETIVLKAMAKDREARYATARELGDDLQRFLDGRPVLARPVRWPQRAVRWARRRTEWVLAAAAALALAAAGAGMAAWRIADAEQQTAHALEETQEQRRAARLQATRLALNRGLAQCDEGHVAIGLLWLARGLETCPAGEPDLEHVLRANLAAWAGELPELIAALPHPGDVHQAQFLPDGHSVLTFCGDGQVRLWNLRDLATVREMFPLSGDVTHARLALSPDGTTAATIASDGSIRRWDVASGKQVGDVLEVFAWPLLAFTPDSQRLAANVGSEIREWSARGDEEELARYAGGDNVSLAYSPDGAFLVLGELPGHLHVWNRQTGEHRTIQRAFSKPEAPLDTGISTLAFDPTSALLAVGTSSHVVLFCRWPAIEPFASRDEHLAGVTSLAVSADGALLASASDDGTVRLWRIASGEPYEAPIELDAPAFSVAFDGAGQRIVTSENRGEESEARVFARPAPALRRKAISTAHDITAGALTPDGRYAFIGYRSGVIHRLSAADGEPTGVAMTLGATVGSLTVSHDGKHLAATGERRLRVWDLDSGMLRFESTEYCGGITPAAFAPDGTTIAFHAAENEVRFVDLRSSREVLRRLPSAGGPVLRFSGRGDRLFIAGLGQPSALWDLSGGGRKIADLPHPQSPDSAAFDAQRNWWVVGNFSGVASYWDAETGRQAKTRRRSPRPYGQMQLAANGQRALAYAGNGSARLFDLATMLPIGPPLPHFYTPHASALTPEGDMVLTTTRDQSQCLWRVPAPAAGEPRTVTAWVERITGRRLDEEGVAQVLSADEWNALGRGSAGLSPSSKATPPHAAP